MHISHQYKLNIGMITYPYSEMEESMLPAFLRDILEPLSQNLFVVTGDFPEIDSPKLHITKLPWSRNESKSLLSRTIKYILPQLRILPSAIKIYRKCDLIIFFSIAELYLVPILMAKLLRKKVAIARTGNISTSYGVPYRNKLLGMGKIVPNILRLIENINFSLANKIFLESESIVEFARLSKYRDKICIGYAYFVDTNTFNIKRELKDRRNLIGYIGGFTDFKGAINFARAISLILAERDDVEFLMVGGEGLEFRKIEEELRLANIRDKVMVKGRVPHQEIPEHLNQLKLFVLPSYGEGVPQIVLEAMACGVPVLATPVGGIPDVIKDEETGFILKDNSSGCIAEGAIRVLQYPKLDEIVRNALNLVEREYTIEPILRKWTEILGPLTEKELR